VFYFRLLILVLSLLFAGFLVCLDMLFLLGRGVLAHLLILVFCVVASYEKKSCFIVNDFPFCLSRLFSGPAAMGTRLLLECDFR